MPIKNEPSTRFMDEIRIISPWVVGLASLVFVGAIVGLALIAHFDKTAPPVPLMALLGTIPGTLLACYILLIGYIWKDTDRRGMSRILWTLLAIFVPNALGIVLYFVLRKPRLLNCPQCSAVVEPGFGFCPRCRHSLSPVCPHCQRGVTAGDKFCPYCGGDVGVANAVSTPTPDHASPAKGADRT